MFCEYVSTTGNQPTQRIGSAYDGPRDRTVSMLTVECRYNYFFLWRAIDFFHDFVRQNVRPLTAATFGDWLSSRTQTHSHRFRTITIRLKDGDCLTTAMVGSKLQY